MTPFFGDDYEHHQAVSLKKTHATRTSVPLAYTHKTVLQ
jgi:hypothetical protein